MGWGTADTEALTGFLAQDKIPDISGSYAAALTDPEGTSGKAKPAPYNFFYRPELFGRDARDADRGRRRTGKPRANRENRNSSIWAPTTPIRTRRKRPVRRSPSNSASKCCRRWCSRSTPGDYSAQCLSLKSSGANYAYLGNTAASNVSVLKACKTAGVDVQFMGNVWGMDENAAKTAGDAANGVIFPLRTAVAWGGNAPGMKTVMEISKMSDPTGKVYRPVHYIAAVCSALYLKEALDWAAKNGGATGENVAKGFYQKKDWVPAGMDGVCNASTWTEKDHRGTHEGRSLSLEDFGTDRWRPQ